MGVKANAPIFSTSGSRPPAPFENKVFLGVVGAIVIAMAFFGTYKGANIFFSNAYGSPGGPTDNAADAKSFSPAKRAYIAKLDRLCAKDQDRMERFQARLLASESPRELQRVFDRLLELAERNLARIEGFDKPKEDRRLLNRIIGLQRETLPLLDRILDAVQARNSAAVDAIAAEVYANAAKSRRLMGVYGFKVCGEA